MEIAYKAGWSRNPEYLTEFAAKLVTNIGTAFTTYGKNDTTYSFPEFKYFTSVTSVSNNAFGAANNTKINIAVIEFPNSVTSINAGLAFYSITGYCELCPGIKLTGLVFYSWNTHNKVIWNGGDLTSYTGGNSTYPFNSIKIIKWNDLVNPISKWVLTSYSKCQEFQSDVFEAVDGMLFGYSTSADYFGERVLHACPRLKTNAYIPDDVTMLGEKAFAYNVKTNWVIPNLIKYIGIQAFIYAKFLNGELLVPDLVKYIGSEAFRYSNVTKVYLPPSLLTIGTSSMSNFPNGRKYLIIDNQSLPDNGSQYTFTSLSGDWIVYVPENKLSYYSASSYKMLNSNYISKPLRTIPPNWDRTFNSIVTRETNMVNCVYGNITANVSTLLFSDTTGIVELMYNGVTSATVDSSKTFTASSDQRVMPIFADATNIGDDIFKNTTIKICELASKTRTIGNNTFKGCSYLTTINLTNITAIGDSAFEDCSVLTPAALQNVITIGTNAFKNCTGLTTLTLTNCTSIGNSAFTGCTNLDLTTIDAIMAINEHAFD